MAITAEQIRDEFGFYKTFVFEFLYMTVVDDVPTPVTYICKHDPEGITSENIQHIRNRAKYGVFRSFTTDLSFIKEDIDWIKSYIATYHYEGNLLLNIYELNNTTAEYSLLYSGKVELSKYKIENYKMKLTLGDSDLGALIENNGDKEFSITPAEYEPYLKDLEYNGIPIVEQGRLYFGGNEGINIPASPAYPHGNDVYIVLPLNREGAIDSKLCIFNMVNSEVIEYVGSPITLTDPLFIAPVAGDATIFSKIKIGLTAYNNVNIPYSYNLRFCTSNAVSGDHVAISYGNLNWVQRPFDPPDDWYDAVIEVDSGCVFPINYSDGGEIYLILVLHRTNDSGINGQVVCNMVWNIQDIVFREYQTSTPIKGISLPDLTSLALYKATGGLYSSITGISEWNKILFTTGDFTRLLLTYSITVKLNDLIDFIVKALGHGYDYTPNGIAFDENYKFFDPSVLLQIENPTGFVEEAMTDYLYNTITVGFEPYDTEYLSGKLAMHEKTIWKTPVNSNNNDFNLVPSISGNPFEIEDVVRKAINNQDLTDYESDSKLFAIWCKITDGVYSIDKDNYDLANSQVFAYMETIYNLELTPARILQRNLFNVNQSLINDTDTINKQMRTKNEDYYSNYIGSPIPVCEGRDFMLYPRCGSSTAPRLYSPESAWRLDPVRYTMNIVPELLSSLTDRRKLILFKIDGVIRAGYIDDIGYNPNTHEPKNIKLIKAHLTQEEIDTLWV